MQKVDFLQFIKSLVGQAYGYLALLGYVFGSIGRFVFFKTFGYERHDEDGDEVAVTAADVACILIETEVPDVLSGIRQFRSEKADGPRYLQPQQEHGKCRKTTVNGVVL